MCFLALVAPIARAIRLWRAEWELKKQLKEAQREADAARAFTVATLSFSDPPSQVLVFGLVQLKADADQQERARIERVEKSYGDHRREAERLIQLGDERSTNIRALAYAYETRNLYLQARQEAKQVDAALDQLITLVNRANEQPAKP